MNYVYYRSVQAWTARFIPATHVNVLYPRDTVRRVCTSLHLLECALYAQLTHGHAYLVAHTMVTAIAVLLLPVLDS